MMPRQPHSSAKSDITLSVDEMAQHAEEAARLLKLMANPNRLMILCRLMEQDFSVTELNEHLPISQSALSQHLAMLRKHGLVTFERDQQTLYYRLASPGVEAIVEVLYRLYCSPGE